MKKLLCMMLSVMLLAGCMNISASAAEAVYPKVSHVLTSTEDSASDDWSVDQRGVYLLNGRSSITRTDNTHISISGNTKATQTCDTVRLTLYVERSTSYSTGYGNYRTYSYSADDAYALDKAISNISVDRGYYYRVKGVHSVTHNGVTETTDSVTDPIDYR